jgi:hypothetical protein
MLPPWRTCDADGAARLLYFDRQYNDTLGLLHEDARDDSVPLMLEGRDSSILEVRLLSLARRKLIKSAALRQRAEEALHGCVGETTRVQGSIELAVRIVSDIAAHVEKSRRRSV